MNKTGKTLRKVPNYRPEERHLSVKKKDGNIHSVDIFDNQFANNVQYSMKKHQRWLIPSLLVDDFKRDENDWSVDDQPVTYSITQSRKCRGQEKANCIIDTISKKMIGSHEVSDRKYIGSTVNLRSALKELNQPNDKNFAKIKNPKISKNKKLVSKKQNKGNFYSSGCFSYDPSEFPTKGNLNCDHLNKRQDCIYMEEFVPVNNPLDPNIGYIWRESKKKKISTLMNKVDYILDSDDDYSIDEEETEDIIQFQPPRKSFFISENDIIPRNLPNTEKRRTKRKLPKQIKYISEELNESKVFDNEEFEVIEEFHAEKLPSLIINQLWDKTLKVELELISSFCRCWCSDAFPRFILINLDGLTCRNYRNFMVLRPYIENDCGIVILKVVFNITDFDCTEILNQEFPDLTTLITCLQSRLNGNGNTKSTKHRLLEFDEPIQGLSNTWKTKEIKSPKPIFCFGDEWEHFELDQNKLSDASYGIEMGSVKLTIPCDCCQNLVNCNDAVIFNKCRHKICDSCLSNHIGPLLKRVGEHGMKCPIYDCETALDCATILSSVSFTKCIKHVDNLEKELMQSMGVCCQNCRFVTIIKERKTFGVHKQLAYECNCKNIACGFCGEKQHWPISCDKIKAHNWQLVKLNDQKIIPTKPKVEISSERICKMCHKNVPRRNDYPDYVQLRCYCIYLYCRNCGFTHNRKGFKCLCNITNQRLNNELSLLPPNPDSFRPKLYCQSMNIRLQSHHFNISKMLTKLANIDSKIKDCKYFNNDRKSLIAQYTQILCVVESIYVILYQMNNKNKLMWRQTLTISAKNLMFYVYQFESKVDELNEILCVRKVTSTRAMEILRKRDKINNYLTDAMKHVSKLYSLIN